jgi:ribosomal protein L32
VTRASERELAATLATLAVVDECPECEERYLAERRCPDCQLFTRRLGRGGQCPHCEEPLAVSELAAGVALAPARAPVPAQTPAGQVTRMP